MVVDFPVSCVFVCSCIERLNAGVLDFRVSRRSGLLVRVFVVCVLVVRVMLLWFLGTRGC